MSATGSHSDDIDSPSILITGGTGFLGLHTCEHFLKKGWNVTAFDLKPFEPEDDMDHVDFIQGDVRDGAVLREAMAGMDYVIHAAAALALWDDGTIWDVTVTGTQNVLSIADEIGIKRVVYISSIVVYGDTDTHPITEDEPLDAIGAYGESKIQAEALCHEYRDQLCVPILRPPSFIGPRRLGIFHVLFDWIDDGANIPLIGPGNNRYQLLHVSDLVNAIDLMLSVQLEIANETYNVGADEFGTMKEDFQAPIDYAETGKRTVGTPVRPTAWILRALERLNLSPLYPWIYETAHKDYYLSVEKLKGIGWQPEYSNQEALVETYKWYLDEYTTPSSQSTSSGSFDHRAGWDQGVLTLVKRLFQLF